MIPLTWSQPTTALGRAMTIVKLCVLEGRRFVVPAIITSFSETVKEFNISASAFSTDKCSVFFGDFLRIENVGTGSFIAVDTLDPTPAVVW